MLITGEIVRRIERVAADDALATVAALRELEPGTPAIGVELAGGALVLEGPGMYVNRALGVGLVAALRPADVEQVESLSRQVGVAPSIEVCPHADPVMLGLLGRCGYRAVSFHTALVRSLDQLPESDRALAIAPVSDAPALALWKRAAAEGNGISGSDGLRILDRYTDARYRVAGEQLYVVEAEGEVAAVAALSVRDGVAVLGGMSTRPGFRGRGLQAAVIADRLHRGAALGCDLAVVEVDPGSGSERNVQRLGFEIAYTRLTMERSDW